jgi:hypothetical protein
VGALYEIRAHLGERFERGLVVNTFGGRLQLELTSDADDALDHAAIVA